METYGTLVMTLKAAIEKAEKCRRHSATEEADLKELMLFMQAANRLIDGEADRVIQD
jgi:hypothetical protein